MLGFIYSCKWKILMEIKNIHAYENIQENEWYSYKWKYSLKMKDFMEMKGIHRGKKIIYSTGKNYQ